MQIHGAVVCYFAQLTAFRQLIDALWELMTNEGEEK